MSFSGDGVQFKEPAATGGPASRLVENAVLEDKHFALHFEVDIDWSIQLGRLDADAASLPCLGQGDDTAATGDKGKSAEQGNVKPVLMCHDASRDGVEFLGPLIVELCRRQGDQCLAAGRQPSEGDKRYLVATVDEETLDRVSSDCSDQIGDRCNGKRR